MKSNGFRSALFKRAVVIDKLFRNDTRNTKRFLRTLVVVIFGLMFKFGFYAYDFLGRVFWNEQLI